MSLAVAIFLRSSCKKKVLLIKRRDVPVYALPGGGVENNEDPLHAAIREMREETGLDIEIIRIIGHYYPLNKLTHPTILYEGKKLGGIETSSNETQEVAYFPIDSLPSLLPPPYADWIQDGQKELQPLFKGIQSVTYGKFVFYLFKHPILVFRFILARLGRPINT